MNTYCRTNEHEKCPDSKHDTFSCSCPCHLTKEELERLMEEKRRRKAA